MPNKYSRTNFFKREIVKGKTELDLPFNSFNEFEFKRPHTFYTVKEQDLYRPDLISLRMYGKNTYWWMILKINHIEDLYNDLVVGKSLIIPDINDIEDYFISARKNR